MKNNILLTLPFVLVTSAQAQMRTTTDLMQGERSHVSYGSEICIFPQRLDSVKYSKSDLEDEVELCGMNFTEGVAQNLSGNFALADQKEIILKNQVMATCAKLNSTNPGVLLIPVPSGWTQNQTMQTLCKHENRLGNDVKDFHKVEAKFKQSITCSYTSSALGAYHVSRALGNVLKTPVSVVRTKDAQAHELIADSALSLLSGDSNSIIFKTWSQYKNSHASASDPKIFADGGQKIYGALMSNVKKEFNYTEVSGVGPYDTRYTRFVQQSPFKRVADGRSVLEVAGGQRNFVTMGPIIQQMRDVSDMVVLDTLLSQDDRIGNIHFQLYTLNMEEGQLKRTKLDKKLAGAIIGRMPNRNPSRASEAQLAAISSEFKDALKGGRLIRVMVLKDNDCGVDVDRRGNMMRMVDGIEQVRHLDPDTYKNLLKLHQRSKDPQFKSFFLKTLLFRNIDFEGHKRSFMNNLNRAVEVLQGNCRNGSLKLDLTNSFDATGNWQEKPSASCELQ